MKLDENNLEGLQEKLTSMPKPNMKTHKKEEIYNHLVRIERTESVITTRYPLCYYLRKMTIPVVGVAVLMIYSIIGFSYIERENKTNPYSLPPNNHTNQNAQSPFDLGDVPVQQNLNQVSTFGMTYTINSVESTKEKGSLPIQVILERMRNKEIVPWDSLYESMTFDNQGNITNNYSYIIVNLTIQNDMDYPQETLFLNSCYLLGKNEKGDYIDKFEAMLFDKRLDVESKDYFHYPLKPKESVTFNLGFIAQDEDLDLYKNKMDLIINNSGTNKLDDENVRIIPLTY